MDRNPNESIYNQWLIMVLILNTILQSYIFAHYTDYSFSITGVVFGAIYATIIILLWRESGKQDES